MQLTREQSANSGTATKPSYQTQNVVVLLIIERTKLSPLFDYPKFFCEFGYVRLPTHSNSILSSIKIRSILFDQLRRVKLYFSIHIFVSIQRNNQFFSLISSETKFFFRDQCFIFHGSIEMEQYSSVDQNANFCKGCGKGTFLNLKHSYLHLFQFLVTIGT